MTGGKEVINCFTPSPPPSPAMAFTTPNAILPADTRQTPRSKSIFVNDQFGQRSPCIFDISLCHGPHGQYLEAMILEHGGELVQSDIADFVLLPLPRGQKATTEIERSALQNAQKVRGQHVLSHRWVTDCIDKWTCGEGFLPIGKYIVEATTDPSDTESSRPATTPPMSPQGPPRKATPLKVPAATTSGDEPAPIDITHVDVTPAHARAIVPTAPGTSAANPFARGYPQSGSASLARPIAQPLLVRKGYATTLPNSAPLLNPPLVAANPTFTRLIPVRPGVHPPSTTTMTTSPQAFRHYPCQTGPTLHRPPPIPSVLQPVHPAAHVPSADPRVLQSQVRPPPPPVAALQKRNPTWQTAASTSIAGSSRPPPGATQAQPLISSGTSVTASRPSAPVPLPNSRIPLSNQTTPSKSKQDLSQQRGSDSPPLRSINDVPKTSSAATLNPSRPPAVLTNAVQSVAPIKCTKRSFEAISPEKDASSSAGASVAKRPIHVPSPATTTASSAQEKSPRRGKRIRVGGTTVDLSDDSDDEESATARPTKAQKLGVPDIGIATRQAVTQCLAEIKNPLHRKQKETFSAGSLKKEKDSP